MALTLDWQTDGPAQAAIRHGGFAVARLCGVPSFLTIPVRDRLVEIGDVTAAGVVVEQLDPEEAG